MRGGYPSPDVPIPSGLAPMESGELRRCGWLSMTFSYQWQVMNAVRPSQLTGSSAKRVPGGVIDVRHTLYGNLYLSLDLLVPLLVPLGAVSPAGHPATREGRPGQGFLPPAHRPGSRSYHRRHGVYYPAIQVTPTLIEHRAARGPDLKCHAAQLVFVPPGNQPEILDKV